jgi:hypothetical protein
MRKHHFLSSLVIFVAGFTLSAIVDGRRLASPGQGTLSNPAVGEVSAQFTRQPSNVQRWEYRVVTTLNRRNDQGIDYELNRLGGVGFEVCAVAQNGNEVGNFIIVLKRLK